MPSRDSRYSAYYEGIWTDVIKTEDAVRAILCIHKNDLDRIEYLEKENKELKAEAWKDEELQKMKTELAQMRADYHRGFPITEAEQKAIEAWCDKHDEEVHGLNNDHKKLKAGGAIGGRYSYHFVPTSIGTSGVVRCGKCGAEFEFCELG